MSILFNPHHRRFISYLGRFLFLNFIIFCIPSVSAGGATIFAHAPPVSIEDFIHQGSGCPNGSVRFEISEDGNEMIMWFDRFSVASGPRIAEPLGTRSCSVSLSVQPSKRIKFAVYSIETVGSAFLDDGLVVDQVTEFKLDQQAEVSRISKFEGPYQGKFSQDDQLNHAIWSECGRSMSFKWNSTVSIENNVPSFQFNGSNSSPTGLWTFSEDDSALVYRVHLKWKRCFK